MTRNNKAGLKRLLGGQKGPYNISFSDFFFFYPRQHPPTKERVELTSKLNHPFLEKGPIIIHASFSAGLKANSKHKKLANLPTYIVVG